MFATVLHIFPQIKQFCFQSNLYDLDRVHFGGDMTSEDCGFIKSNVFGFKTCLSEDKSLQQKQQELREKGIFIFLLFILKL